MYNVYEYIINYVSIKKVFVIDAFRLHFPRRLQMTKHRYWKSNLANFRRKARIYHSVIDVNVQCEECEGMVRVVYNFQFSSKTPSVLRYYYMRRPVGNSKNYNNGWNYHLLWHKTLKIGHEAFHIFMCISIEKSTW